MLSQQKQTAFWKQYRERENAGKQINAHFFLHNVNAHTTLKY